MVGRELAIALTRWNGPGIAMFTRRRDAIMVVEAFAIHWRESGCGSTEDTTMERTKSIEKFSADADALFAPIMDRAMASANQRLDARISRTTYSGDSPPRLQAVGKVLDTASNDSSESPSESRTEE